MEISYDLISEKIQMFWVLCFSSVAQLCSTLCDPVNCSTPGLPVHHQLPKCTPNPCPLCWWYHPTISSSFFPFSSCPQSFPASGSLQMSQFFASGGQSIGVSASTSVLCLELCKTVDIKILPCSPETITALLIGCPLIQNKKFKTKTRF